MFEMLSKFVKKPQGQLFINSFLLFIFLAAEAAFFRICVTQEFLREVYPPWQTAFSKNLIFFGFLALIIFFVMVWNSEKFPHLTIRPKFFYLFLNILFGASFFSLSIWLGTDTVRHALYGHLFGFLWYLLGFLILVRLFC